MTSKSQERGSEDASDDDSSAMKIVIFVAVALLFCAILGMLVLRSKRNNDPANLAQHSSGEDIEDSSRSEGRAHAKENSLSDSLRHREGYTGGAEGTTAWS